MFLRSSGYALGTNARLHPNVQPQLSHLPHNTCNHASLDAICPTSNELTMFSTNTWLKNGKTQRNEKVRSLIANESRNTARKKNDDDDTTLSHHIPKRRNLSRHTPRSFPTIYPSYTPRTVYPSFPRDRRAHCTALAKRLPPDGVEHKLWCVRRAMVHVRAVRFAVRAPRMHMSIRANAT